MSNDQETVQAPRKFTGKVDISTRVVLSLRATDFCEQLEEDVVVGFMKTPIFNTPMELIAFTKEKLNEIEHPDANLLKGILVALLCAAVIQYSIDKEFTTDAPA